MKTKICKCCLKRKPIESFHKNKAMDDGYKIYCKKCSSEKARQYRYGNLEHYREREKEYRILRSDKISEYQEKYYSRPEVKEKLKKYFKRYQKTHRASLNEYHREYYDRNKERLSKKALEYYYKKKKKNETISKTKRTNK